MISYRFEFLDRLDELGRVVLTAQISSHEPGKPPETVALSGNPAAILLHDVDDLVRRAIAFGEVTLKVA